MAEDNTPIAPRFVIQMPGGRVARIPKVVLDQYVEAGKSAHCPEGNADDVIAHDTKTDPTTGVSDFHTDWEHGDCDYDDGSGIPQKILAWHRHPFGTEYTELYEG